MLSQRAARSVNEAALNCPSMSQMSQAGPLTLDQLDTDALDCVAAALEDCHCAVRATTGHPCVAFLQTCRAMSLLGPSVRLRAERTVRIMLSDRESAAARQAQPVTSCAPLLAWQVNLLAPMLLPGGSMEKTEVVTLSTTALPVAKLRSRSRDILELDLSDQMLCDIDMRIICAMVRVPGALPRLEELKLDKCLLSEKAAQQLAAALHAGALPRLRKLRLCKNVIGNEGIEAITAALFLRQRDGVRRRQSARRDGKRRRTRPGPAGEVLRLRPASRTPPTPDAGFSPCAVYWP